MSKVTVHSYGVKEVSEYAKEARKKSLFVLEQDMAQKEELKASAKRVEVITEQARQENINAKVINEAARRRQIPVLINQITVEGKTHVLVDILGEMFLNSLHLDDSFKALHETTLRSLVVEHLNQIGGFTALEESIKRTNSQLLKNLRTVCTEAAAAVSRRKLKESNAGTIDTADIRFELDEAEREALNLSKDDLNLSEISDLVRKKVLTVVKDEKTRQSEEDEIYQDIQSETSEETTVRETFERVVLRKSPVEESTLFNSLFRSSYKDAITESTAVANGGHLAIMDNDEDPNLDNVNADRQDAMDDGFTYQGEVEDKELLNDDDMALDMDLVLAESITKYTLMEMFYTIKMEDHSHQSIKAMSHKMLN